MPAEKNARSTEKVSAYVCVLFAIVVVGTGLGGMTQTALNTVAAVVLADLGADIGWGQWLTTLYIFSMGAAVPLASFLQRRFSIRSLMLIAYGLYFVGSLCDFLAMTFPILIIGRVLEAVGTGILMPLLQTIAMTRFPEADMARPWASRASRSGSRLTLARPSVAFSAMSSAGASCS